MAKQQGYIRMEGTLGELNFYHHKLYGDLVRRKGGNEGGRIRKDPAFARTRENSQEFGMAARAGKLIRQALKRAFPHFRDPTITHRLTQCLVKIKAFDTTSVRGERRVAKGLTSAEGRELLRKLDFCSGAPLEKILNSEISVDLNTGTLSLPFLSLPDDLKVPPAATHVRFQVLCADLDFEAKHFTHSVSAAQELAVDNPQAGLVLSFTPPVPSGTVLVFLSVRFLQELNGERYLLEEGSFVSSVNG